MSYRPKIWYAYTTSQHDSGSYIGWVPPGHTSFSLCKAKNAKNGTLDITLGPRVLNLRTLYIWNQSHLGGGGGGGGGYFKPTSFCINVNSTLARLNPWSDNIGRVPTGPTSSHWCVKLKNVKNRTFK